MEKKVEITLDELLIIESRLKLLKNLSDILNSDYVDPILNLVQYVITMANEDGGDNEYI